MIPDSAYFFQYRIIHAFSLANDTLHHKIKKQFSYNLECKMWTV